MHRMGRDLLTPAKHLTSVGLDVFSPPHYDIGDLKIICSFVKKCTVKWFSITKMVAY